MTIQVTIKHDNVGYQHDIKVVQTNDAGEPTNPNSDRILKGGESAVFLVYGNNKLSIEEVKNEA